MLDKKVSQVSVLLLSFSHETLRDLSVKKTKRLNSLAYFNTSYICMNAHCGIFPMSYSVNSYPEMTVRVNRETIYSLT